MALYEHIFIARQDVSQQQVEQLLELFPAAVTDVGEVIEWFSHVAIVTSFPG